jgi:oligoribonuclease NrnB/cAMP/cGMP phosphodiesterase (DHH superfamily)
VKKGKAVSEARAILMWNTFARKYFNGGGHFNAAGGQNKETLAEVVEKFKKALKENSAQLSSYNF